MDHSRYTELLERAKVESDRRVKAIFDGVQTFVFLMLIDGTVVEVNRSALDFRVLRREEVTGTPLWDGPWLAGADDARNRMIEAVEEAALGTPFSFSATIDGRQGCQCRFSFMSQPVFSAKGEVLYVLVEGHDMTDFLRVQDRNRQLELEMMQNHKMESLGTLASGVAHEINTPMQYIRDNLDFLAGTMADVMALARDAADLIAAARAAGVDNALDSRLAEWHNRAEAVDLGFVADEAPQAIRQSCEGVERVREIVQAIKHFSRADLAEFSYESLEKLINSTLMVSRNQWKYVAGVATDFAPDMPPVRCHPGEIEQVILNLLINAVHAIEDKVGSSGETGTIAIALRQDGDNAVITVSDSGAGIDPKNQGRVFDLFFTTKEPGRGTGHGLSISQTIIVRKHGGSIGLQSTPGQGTTFTVTLPINGKRSDSAPLVD